MLLPQLVRNEKGYIMPVVLAAAAVLSGLAFYLLQGAEQHGNLEERELVEFDRETLLTDLRLVLSDPENCSLNIKGTFAKSDIHKPESQPGLPVEVWTWVGGEKKNLLLKEAGRYGRLKIQSSRLFMNFGNPDNYLPGVGAELGTLRVKADGGAGGAQTIDLVVRVSHETGGAGQSTITGCKVPPDETKCSAFGMIYDSATGDCNFADVCDDPLEVVDATLSWEGEVNGLCTENYGSHIRDLNFSQIRNSGEEDSNGLGITCCFPRSMMTMRCFDFEEGAPVEAWTGSKEALCDMRSGGMMGKLLFSQLSKGSDTEVNGLLIRCCYPW